MAGERRRTAGRIDRPSHEQKRQIAYVYHIFNPVNAIRLNFFKNRAKSEQKFMRLNIGQV